MWSDERLPLALSSVGEAGTNVLLGEVGEIRQNLRHGHTRREIREDVVNGDPHPADAGLTATLSGLDRDNRLERLIHCCP